MAQSDQNDFTLGQTCYLSGKGVGRIAEKTSRTIDGKLEEFWKLDLPHKQTALIPISRAQESIRALISKKSATEILEILLKPGMPFDTRDIELKKTSYFHSLSETGLDPKPMAQHLRALYAAPAELSFEEKKALIFFEAVLVSELAVVLERPYPDLIRKFRTRYPAAYLGIHE